MPWRQVFALIVFNRENSWSAFTNVLLIDYILITNLMHWLLFIHKIISSSTCFEPQMLIFRRIQLCTCSIWYCHSLWEFVVACRYTAWVRTDCRGKVVGGCLKTPTNNLPSTVSEDTHQRPSLYSVWRHPPTTFPLQCLKTPTNNLPSTVS